MFWGLIMEPNKRYTQVVEKPFHISQAAMDISTGDNDPCQVMVVVDGKNFLVCTLQRNKCNQVPLDLYFKMGDSVAFLTNGKCNIHLTGYLDPEFMEEPSDDEEEEEEVPELVSSKSKRKLDNSGEAAPKKKVRKDKKAVAAESDSDEDDDDEDENQLQKLLDADMDSDENDDSFKMNTSAEASDSDEEDSDEEGEEEEEEDGEKDSSDEAETTLDTSHELSNVDLSKLSNRARKRLRKLQAQQKQGTPQVNGVEKAVKTKPKQDGQQKEKSAEKKEKNEKKKEAKLELSGEKKEKKSLNGGVHIEDLKVGNGPVAKAGKTVMVYYEGKLKQNNKMFDNCLKGPGFKFRLGAKEVIAGWDVGVAGMKVGGKRRIICPPAMAYGAKGSPPVIPPNSSLVFEVELKNVK